MKLLGREDCPFCGNCFECRWFYFGENGDPVCSIWDWEVGFMQEMYLRSEVIADGSKEIE